MIESLAFSILSRIEDVLYADSMARNSPRADYNDKHTTLPEDSDKSETPNCVTLKDFMGWEIGEVEDNMKKNNSSGNLIECYFKGENEKLVSKPQAVVTPKRVSYLERLENLSGLRSPRSRH